MDSNKKILNSYRENNEILTDKLVYLKEKYEKHLSELNDKNGELDLIIEKLEEQVKKTTDLSKYWEVKFNRKNSWFFSYR